MAWEKVDGVDWQVLEDDVDQTVIGWTVAHGLLDETAADLGALRYAAGVLRRELGRPVELGAGDVSVPEVAALVKETTLTVTVRGRRDAVVSAWERLPAVVGGPVDGATSGPMGDLAVAPHLDDDVDPVPARVSVWGTDVAARCGASALSLIWLGVTVPDALERGRALLRRLSPFTGEVPGVFFTNDAELPGRVLAGGADMRSREPVRRSDGPTVDRAGTLEATGGSVLFSVVVPRGLAGLAAADVLAGCLAETVADVAGTDVPVGVQVTELHEHLILTLQTAETLTGEPRDRVIDRLALAPLPIPDRAVDTAVENRAQAPSPAWQRERRVLGLPEEAPPTAAQVRSALGLALGSVHLARERGSEPVPGFDPLVPDLPTEHLRSFSTWIARQRDPRVADAPAKLGIGPTMLRPDYHGGTRPGADAGVSLADAVIVVEDDASGMTVVDAAMRRVSFVVDTFQRPKALRSLLDRRLKGVPRARSTDSERTAAIRALGLRSRRWLRPVVVLAVLMLGFIAFMAISQAFGAPGPVQERVSVGETVKLGNGSTVTVRNVDTVRSGAYGTRTTLTVDFCAGEDTRARGVSPSIQQRVAPGDFVLWGGGALRATRTGVGSGELGTVTLARGQCTQGKLAFDLNGDVGQGRVAYANGYNDDVVWYIR
ncbi:hypothetical protein V6N00_06500 [Tersicoccus sp. MR15.9]|uniref:hypothetical protein n=1 Tax=Tersicoccus mangrovi TaxID=3121635 RepID=UPI002FE60643